MILPMQKTVYWTHKARFHVIRFYSVFRLVALTYKNLLYMNILFSFRKSSWYSNEYRYIPLNTEIFSTIHWYSGDGNYIIYKCWMSLEITKVKLMHEHITLGITLKAFTIIESNTSPNVPWFHVRLLHNAHSSIHKSMGVRFKSVLNWQWP